MATSFEPIKFANLTEKTTAPADADIIVIEDSTATKKAKWSNLISWIKSKLNIGSADISGIGDGTVTGAISEQNTKLLMRSETLSGTGGNYIFVTIPTGYTLITAMNPNWANEYYVTGVSAYTNGFGVLFWNKEIPTSVSFTVNTFWIKN